MNSERTSEMPAPLFFVSGRLSGAPEGFRDTSWVNMLAPTAADEEAAPVVAATVLATEAIGPQMFLLASADDRQEVRSLAARCSAALYHPEALVGSFENEVQFRDWRRHLDALRQLASRSVTGAEAVRKALVDKYDHAGGAAFFEIVQGFTPEEVGSDPDTMQVGVIGSKLLPMLDSADLATRVLGSIALYELVEHRGAPFDPIETERRDRRNRAVTRLENYLKRDELTVLTP